MTKDQIVEGVHSLVSTSAAGNSVIGSLDADPYKLDLFKLFKAAYDAGMTEVEGGNLLTGASLYDAYQAKWPVKEGSKEHTLLWHVCNDMWNQWRYALNHK